MNNIVKTILCAGLLISAGAFGYCFYTNYNQFMAEQIKMADVDPLQVRTVANARLAPSNTNRYSRLLVFGGAFFVSVVGLGLIFGHEVSHYVANRFGKLLFNDEGEGIKDSEYELAEQAWANGNPLEAIQLMRNYLQQHPREQHVALRIAEIYEKDLNNPLAAALEYEEVLQQKLSAEQWGWTAIHLCNLYASKMNKPDKAVALLHRIVDEYGQTSAADKARKRLELSAEETEVGEEESTPLPTPAPVPAPENEAAPVKRPNNSGLQSHFDKFHQGSLPEKHLRH